MRYSDIIQNLASNLLTHFDVVYHSVEIVKADETFPAVSIADEWINLSPTDQREVVYIRRNGNDEVSGQLKIVSCSKAYQMQTPLRIVYFKDHAKKHNEILSKLMQSVLIGGTKLKSIIQDKWKIQKDESSGNYNFGATTAYFAIDIHAIWELQPDICDEDFCLEITNPLKKELCPVVA